MATRIYTNVVAQNVHANMLLADAALQRSIERLSSGLRINRAADDPAGLVISENLRTQISGITQAVKNTTDSINMIKTAEGALTEVHSLLRSMRDLAVHASNTSVNDQTAILADQQQIASAIESINRIASQTQFGNVQLLNGSIGTSYTSAKPAFVTGASGYFAYAQTGLATVAVSTRAAQAAKVGDLQYFALTTNLVATGSAVVIVNGYSVGTFTAQNTIGDVIQAINTKSADTGVTAGLSAGSSGYLTLTHTQYGSDYSILYSDTASVFSTAACTFTQAGTDAVGSITFTGGSTLALDAGKGLRLEAAGGTFKVGLTALATATTYGSAIQVTMGSATFQIGANAGQTATAAIDDVSASQLGTTADPLGFGVSGIDVTTYAGAQTAIAVLDEAVAQISTLRARLGSTQKNVLETNVNSLSVAKQNVAASESSIRDTDMASEIVEFTRNQILVQASVAMLAQANAAPQSLLSLLQ